MQTQAPKTGHSDGLLQLAQRLKRPKQPLLTRDTSNEPPYDEGSVERWVWALLQTRLVRQRLRFDKAADDLLALALMEVLLGVEAKTLDYLTNPRRFA